MHVIRNRLLHMGSLLLLAASCLLNPITGHAMITTDKVFANPQVAQLANAAQDGDLAQTRVQRRASEDGIDELACVFDGRQITVAEAAVNFDI